MKVNELRLGNYIKDAESRDDIVYRVSCLKTDEFLDWDGDGYFNVTAEKESISSERAAYFNLTPSPIPLTKEWLVKLGFNNVEYKEGYIGIEFKTNCILSFVLTAPGTMGEWQSNYCYQFNEGNLSRYVEVKHVHQLQNLYFALTGKELELKN